MALHTTITLRCINMPSPNRHRILPKRSRLALILSVVGYVLLHVSSTSIRAEEHPLQFNPNFMRQTPGQSSDASIAALNTLAAQASLAPGRYQVEVLVNLAPAGKHEIEFREGSDGKGL